VAVKNVIVKDGDNWREDLAKMTSGIPETYTKSVAEHPYSNTYTNTSVRDGFSRDDYNNFREDEMGREGPLGKIADCMDAYLDIPVIHNVINLMSDFSVQGVDVVHPNPETEKFLKEWFKGAKGPERSERMLNMTYKAGTAIIIRDEEHTNLKVGKGKGPKVPWKYTIFSPLNLKLLSPELNAFVTGGASLFAIDLPPELAKTIADPKSAAEKELVKLLPKQIIDAAKNKDKQIPIPPEKVSTISFKKDDGEAWGLSVIRPILPAVQLYRKMVLADLSALDGAISQIRVWKLGNIENKIFPSAGDVQKLANMLMSNAGGGVIDLIWRPDIELIETKNQGWNFLGADKYEQVMTDMYSGLGVPPTLSGTSNAAVGTTNNMVSIKTLIERLEYGRMLLGMFWDAELERVRKAMGFRFPGTLVYDRMVLSDDAAELALLIQLADRDYISVEYLQERFGAMPEIEEVRLRRENRRRKKGLLPKKAGPWHEAEKDHKKELAFIGQGVLTPSQVGLDLGKPNPSEILKPEPKAVPSGTGKGKGQPQQGRPINSKDTKKRKKKRFVPIGASFANDIARVCEAQGAINEYVKPLCLKAYEKSNLRQLTDQESESFENIQFDMLFVLGEQSPTKEIMDDVMARIENGEKAPDKAYEMLKKSCADYKEHYSVWPTIERLRNIKAGVYLFCKED